MRSSKRWIQLAVLIVSVAINGPLAHAGEAAAAAQPATVVFVCEHGSSRSLLAATLFNRIAEQRGLAVRALSRAVSATTVDTKVPPRLVQSMSGDGFHVEAFQPQALSPAEAAGASRVVVINYDGPLDSAGPRPVDHLDDVAPASIEYDKAKRAITSYIESLLADFEAGGSKPGGR